MVPPVATRLQSRAPAASNGSSNHSGARPTSSESVARYATMEPSCEQVIAKRPRPAASSCPLSGDSARIPRDLPRHPGALHLIGAFSWRPCRRASPRCLTMDSRARTVHGRVHVSLRSRVTGNPMTRHWLPLSRSIIQRMRATRALRSRRWRAVFELLSFNRRAYELLHGECRVEWFAGRSRGFSRPKECWHNTGGRLTDLQKFVAFIQQRLKFAYFLACYGSERLLSCSAEIKCAGTQYS